MSEEKKVSSIDNYKTMIVMPWGQLFYREVWQQLGDQKGKEILDFGAGFGVTASHLAENNHVMAMEPNQEMIDRRENETPYQLIHGGIEYLKKEPDSKYDVIICHNVLEYVQDRETLVGELVRVLKPDGIISIVKHNKPGTIMQKVVFENNLEAARSLLEDHPLESANFGTIRIYENSEIEKLSHEKLHISECFGVRTFFALQRNEFKTDPEWLDNMLKIESMAWKRPEFIKVSFFNHLILHK